MRSRPANTRVLFFALLTAIVLVYAAGRVWLQRGEVPEGAQAGIVSSPAGASGE